jgi:OFA family oxalate/formate antiporter-like MFS transporter
MTASALMLKSYPSDDKEVGYVDVSHATRSLDFIMLWIIFFINITCGIAILSVASPMGEAIGMNAVEAAGMVGMIGLINGGGRIFFATISDYIGRAFTYILFFMSEAVFFYILANTPNVFLFQSVIFCIVACYGGGFSCMPAYLADIFGTKYLSAIHGRILTAWGIAGLVGPYIITKCYENTGAYRDALYLFICLIISSFVLSIILAVRNSSR